MNEISSAPMPFFIVGCSRSGTTLLQALIDGHPDFAIPPESHVYVRFGPIFESYGDLGQRRNRLRLIDALLRDVFIRQWRLDATTEDIERRLTRADRIGIIDTLFSLYAEKNGATRWGDKTPEHIRHLREIRADFPRAKLIHLVRDGRDVAEAMRRMIWGPVSAVGLAEEWRREVMHWQAYVDDHGSEDSLIVRYEDLVTSPHETLRIVLDFLGARFVDTVETYASSPLSRTLGTTQSTWHSSLRQGVNTAKVGIYRRRFAPREIEIMEAVAGVALDAYGYAREHPAPRPVSGLERRLGLAKDRAVRWSRKIKHPPVIWMELQHRLRMAHRLWPRYARARLSRRASRPQPAAGT